MISIPTWLLYATEQLLFILLVVSIFFFIRARKLNQLASALQTKLAENASIKKAPPVTEKEVEPADIAGQALLAAHDQQGTSPDSQAMSKLQDKLTIQNKRVDNLERFRVMYFDLKKRIEELMKIQSDLNFYMENTPLPTDSTTELKADYERIKKEKENLELQLQQVTEQIDVLIDGSTSNHAVATDDANATDLIENQKLEISKLIQEIADLEIESASSQRILGSVDQLHQQSNELTMAIEILQDENQFLLDQVETLLQQNGQKENQCGLDIDLVSTQLEEKQQEYDLLYEKYAELEREYLNTQK